MNVSSLLSPEYCHNLAVTLGHCLWQGLAIAALAAGAGRLLRRRDPRWRYGIDLAALVLIVACLPVTYLVVENQAPPSAGRAPVRDAADPGAQPAFAQTAAVTQTPAEAAVPRSAPGSPFDIGPGESLAAGAGYQAAAGWLCAAYLLGVTLMLLRFGASLVGIHRLCRDTLPVESPAIKQLLQDLVRDLGLRAAPAIALSRRIASPTVIGIVRPTILLPFRLATALGPDEIAAVLAHELAHIRRYDLWINLFQRFVEALLFFNPAVWYLSRRLSTEREFCCDDVALSRGVGSMKYAELLLRLAEVGRRAPSTAEHQFALAATGTRPSQLRRRISRMLGLEDELALRATRRGTLTVTAALLLAAVASSVFLPSESPAETPADSAADTPALSSTEQGLLGTWERSSFLTTVTLTFTPDRRYRYKYSIPGGNPDAGRWRIDEDTAQGRLLVYETRGEDGETAETTRSRILELGKDRLKLQPLSAAKPGETVTFTRVASQADRSSARPADERAGTKATIRGRIVLADGSPAEAEGWLLSESTVRTGSAASSTSSNQGQFRDTFSVEVPAGTVWLKYFPDGYAPAWAGPIETKPGETIDDVRLVLEPGFSVAARITDDDGRPVAGATLVALPEIGGDSNGPIFERTAGEQGEITLNHLADTPYVFRVEASGYEPLRTRPRDLEKNGALTLTMTRSDPATGVVLNADGTPARGAKLRHYTEFHPDAIEGAARTHQHSGRVVATTDDSGRFTLDRLARSASHLFIVETADEARMVVSDLAAGRRDVVLTVPERRDLRVRIVSDVDRLQLPKRSGKP